MKFKKNQKGMTLVEVVIAIAMFSVMTLAVTYAFSAAMKFNARNMRRDRELGVQQEAIESNSFAGLALNDGTTAPNTSKIKYSGGGTGFTAIEIDATQYKAVKSAENGNDFNFELHTVSSVPFGSVPTKLDKDEGYYNIYVQNNSDQRADVIIEETGGRFYEGDYDRDEEHEGTYVHPSSTYRRSLSAKDPSASYTYDDGSGNVVNFAPDAFLIGFSDTSYDDDTTDISITITIRKEDGTIYTIGPRHRASITSDGKISVTIN